jgi:benzoyl-CoA reductase/2-hydroxyglutaryl-CoA dehydratase subunit BcrC/BadD/HgdB
LSCQKFIDFQRIQYFRQGFLASFRQIVLAVLGQNDLVLTPIVFPNFKIPRLIEEAGLRVAMDDLCSSERVLPGPTHLAEDTKDGVTKALAQRYHLGCLCPTFADDDRRINGIVSPERLKIIRGVVFHLLKGCHPFDLESMVLEKKIKESGLKFIRIETDYTKEDGPTILTRLEAFRATLH